MGKKKFGLFLVVAAGGLHVAAGSAGARDIHVDANAPGPTHDGQDWCTAYLTLHEALTQATPFIDKIFIADGTYTPNPVGLADPRDASFHLEDFIEIYGGYAGCGADDPDERDPRRFETILSGDLDSDDAEFDGDNTENSYHVVRAVGTTTTAVLDGVTITAGNANGAASNFKDYGGGVLVNNGGAKLQGCRIVANAGSRAAGILNRESMTLLTDCVIAGNRARFSGGGLIDLSAGFANNAILKNCLVIDNITGSFGGGIMSDEANTVISNCTIADNVAATIGAGIYAPTNSSPRITDSILWGNVGNNLTDEDAQIFAVGGAPIVNYSCVQGWTGDLNGVNSFGGDPEDDPRFVPGPDGCLYLSQVAAGQPVDSSCLDAGSDTAAAIGFDGTVTTSNHEDPDSGFVDLGYHYPVTGEIFVLGDVDHTGDLNLDDYASWPDCFTGPDGEEPTVCCRIFDFEYDQDVDLFDFAEFAVSLDQP